MIKTLDLTSLVYETWKPLIEGFGNESVYAKTFNFDSFFKFWEFIFKMDLGIIYGYYANDTLIGVIGVIKTPDVHSGELYGQEMFWFVDKNFRGCGIKLLKKAEEWVKQQGCKYFKIAHMSDSMPEKLKTVYNHFGFVETEVHYVKLMGVN